MNKKMISLEISDELREVLRKKAFEEGLSVSAMVRKLLKEALSAEKENANGKNS